MKKEIGFTLAEVLVVMALLAFLMTISLPTIMTGSAEKIYKKGLIKGFESISAISNEFLSDENNYFESTQESAVLFTKFFVENTNIKELYATGNPDKNSETFAALTLPFGTIAGAKNPITISPMVKIGSEPNFWIVTEDNLAYSIVIPKGNKAGLCNEVLNIATAKSLEKALQYSCLAVVVDTNGLAQNPNNLELIDDISKEEYIPDLKNDRFYIFIGYDGATLGNSKHILASKVYSMSTHKN